MATVKALEGRTVHQIQSGQVIVDLFSVVKELVENSLDAGATSIEVRFKNNGLDSIEVQDNGVGVSRDNYETIALKHYTSKLSNYDDLSSLQTFGFRGEALSSLCALSKLHIMTAQAHEAPKGTRLDFESSGKLKHSQVVASQKGTTVIVEDLFINLPVRRHELEKNIKREYGKVLGILQAYACICVKARVAVSNVIAKGKRMTVFATKSSESTRENIANVFGARVLPGLLAMDLNFQMQQTQTSTQQLEPEDKQVRFIGHVSRPVFGEGRQAPDRQMFFVNARPCGLPQVARVFNEVYKTYNISQSPFVFANILLNTNAYDVNVSPDKRTILLHEQSALLESLRTSLTDLFEKQDQTVPQTQKAPQKFPSYKQLTVTRETPSESTSLEPGRLKLSRRSTSTQAEAGEITGSSGAEDEPPQRPGLIESFAERDSKERLRKPPSFAGAGKGDKTLSRDKQKLIERLSGAQNAQYETNDDEDVRGTVEQNVMLESASKPVEDFNLRIAEQQRGVRKGHFVSRSSSLDEAEGASPDVRNSEDTRTPGVVQNAFDRMRPRHSVPELATITIGTKTTTAFLGSSSSPRRRKLENETIATDQPRISLDGSARQNFSSSMKSFAAPGSQLIKTIGKPQSKSRVSRDYAQSISDVEEIGATSSAETSRPSSPNGAQEQEVNISCDDNDETDDDEENSPGNDDSDGQYLDEDTTKAAEEARVAELIRQAEDQSVMPSYDNKKRAYQILKPTLRKDSTTSLIQVIESSIQSIEKQLRALEAALGKSSVNQAREAGYPGSLADASPEDRLSLTVSKTDFTHMYISGQFNLGFILARKSNRDLLIIDQHASDEKYNFERLQATTIVQNQRLVHPRTLLLTAIEEEIILENNDALIKNGFLVEIDTSGDRPIGQRCRLLSLPMSREVTFDITDLEELVALLAESPPFHSTRYIPRPSKVRRMFAMRACRSSVMIGKTLTLKQMEALVKRMGEMDKPWNCPHGRPTMRHICSLEHWEGWKEGVGLTGMEEKVADLDWSGWLKIVKGIQGDERTDPDMDSSNKEEVDS